MSYLDVPGAVAMLATAGGAFIGFAIFVAVCAVIERWRR